MENRHNERMAADAAADRAFGAAAYREVKAKDGPKFEELPKREQQELIRKGREQFMAKAFNPVPD